MDSNHLPSTTSPNPVPADEALSSNLNRLSLGSTASISPVSPGPSSLLSPSEPARLGQQATPTARRTPSATSLRDRSLRDERRKSTPNLQKRSSTASLRSLHNSGGPSSPSLNQRRSSNFATSPTTMFPKRPSLTPVTDSQPTAASIAATHFQKEVDLHQAVDLRSKTLVVVHDACYGHRFSRPRTGRAGLNSIVEKPERIRAGVLGLSAAYVRLGRRHAGEYFAPHPDLDVHLLPEPPFQIRKTARSMALSDPAVTHVHGTKWMDDLKNMCDAAESRLAINGKELVRPQSAGKSDRSNAPLHEGDLYLCSESLNAFQGALGGVCEGVDAVFGNCYTERAFVCIRPPGHHCSAGHPSGFCWVNNVHIGISYAAMTHGLTHAAILDFDLHHGDGSQEITWEQNRKAAAASKNAASHKKTSVGYFSIHDINSYPCEGGDPEKVRNASVCIDKAHGQSIWNIHLDGWKTTSEFWKLYTTRYTLLIEKARAFLRHHTEHLAINPNGPPPKAAIFISAGFDASEWESAGMQRHKVNVPTDFYAKFTADVVQMASEEGLGVDGRVISVLEGGYSDRALTSGIFSHLSGFGDAVAGVENNELNRLTSEMTDRLGLAPHSPSRDPTVGADFSSDWWAPQRLEELEALVYPAPAPVMPREKSGPTYSAPTQSFTAKVTGKDRKSTGSQAEPEPAPLPEVGWATATHELFKALIPGDRQTTSYRPEELNAEASRARRDRKTTSDTGAAEPEENRMKLRLRKPKSSLPSTPKTPKQPASKGSRRTTMDPGSGMAVQTVPHDKSHGMRGDRRKSTPVSETGDFDEVDQTPSRPAVKSGPRSRSGTASSNRPSVPTSARKTTKSATPKRSASPKKAPPVPKVPNAFLPTEPAADSDELDGLTAGVRKLNIKLKVPSPEENAERERKAAESRTANSKSPKKAGARQGRPQIGARSSSAPSTQNAQEKDVKEELPATPDAPTYPQLPNTDAAIADEVSWSTCPPAPKEPSETVLSPPITPGLSDTTTQALYSPSKIAVEDKHGLPVFTSTSAIPFAESTGKDTPEDDDSVNQGVDRGME